MEHLFSTTLDINNTSTAYQVYFDHEKYVFQPEGPENKAPVFSFKRENDEWHRQEPVSTDLQNQALDLLESYLLSQH